MGRRHWQRWIDGCPGSLIVRNAEFANNDCDPGMRMMPSSKTFIFGGVDPRVDLMDIFGLKPGEAAIFRNMSGRVNPALLDTMAILRTMTQAADGNSARTRT